MIEHEKLTLKAPSGTISLPKMDTVQYLELSLNTSVHGHEWSLLGDILYNAHARNKRGVHSITDAQFFWLIQHI